MQKPPSDPLTVELRRQLANHKLQLRESQRELQRVGEYRLIFASHPHPMWTFDLSSRRFLAVNDAAVRHYGYSVEEFLTMTIDDIRPPEDIPALLEALRGAPRCVARLWRHKKKDGTVFDVEIAVEDIQLQDRTVRIVLAQDVTPRLSAEQQLQRSLRALTLLSRGNQAMLHAVDEQELLAGVCQAAVEIGGYEMAWVGFARADARIERAASAGREDDASGDDALPCRVMRAGQAEWCPDRGCLGLPLRHQGTTLGVLLLGSRDSLGNTPEELELMTELADNLAFGIQNLRIRRQREQLEKAVLAVATGVSAGAGAQFFETLCLHLAEACGAAVAGVAEVIPDRPTLARTFACVAHGQSLANCEYSIGDTPCNTLRSQEEFMVHSGLAEEYPLAPVARAFGARAYVGRRLVGSSGQMVGILFVLFSEPLEETGHISATLRIFAARAASEIERKQAQKRVQEQAALLDAAHEAIYVRDLSDRVLYWNRGAEKLYGWSSGEAVGRTVRELLGGGQAEVAEATRILQAQGEWRGEIEKRSKEGHPHTVAVNWTLVRDEQDHPKAVLAINYDVTEQKNLEAQVFRSQRLESIGTLAGGIAHDLNNVLAPITLAAKILKETVPDRDSLELVTTIQQSAQRAADLVRQVLTFARGVPQGERIPVDLIKILQDLLQLVRETFPKSLTIQLTSDCNAAPVCGDQTQLHQVFLNLCVNSRDALSAGGRLEIRLSRRQLQQNPWQLPGGNYFCVEVEDTGEGIPLSLHERIFEPFFTTKEVGKGTGLGLSTSMAIVKSHMGALDVRSLPGQGSTFTVLLPALSPTQAGEPVVARPPSELRGQGELVLVVDDEPTLRRLLQRTLERAGYQVLLAHDGVEALEIYQQHRQQISVVLTDLAMPRMDGLSLVQALKAVDSNLRIIGTSGHGNSEAFARLGVTHFLAKPCPTEVLLECLQQLLASES